MTDRTNQQEGSQSVGLARRRPGVLSLITRRVLRWEPSTPGEVLPPDLELMIYCGLPAYAAQRERLTPELTQWGVRGMRRALRRADENPFFRQNAKPSLDRD